MRLNRPGSIFQPLFSYFGETVQTQASVCCAWLTRGVPCVVYCCCSLSASALTCCVFRNGLPENCHPLDNSSFSNHSRELSRGWHLSGSWNTEISLSGTNSNARFKFTFWFVLKLVTLTMTTWLSELGCCHVTGSLSVCISCTWRWASNKMTSAGSLLNNVCYTLCHYHS